MCERHDVASFPVSAAKVLRGFVGPAFAARFERLGVALCSLSSLGP